MLSHQELRLITQQVQKLCIKKHVKETNRKKPTVFWAEKGSSRGLVVAVKAAAAAASLEQGGGEARTFSCWWYSVETVAFRQKSMAKKGECLKLTITLQEKWEGEGVRESMRKWKKLKKAKEGRKERVEYCCVAKLSQWK